MMAYPLGQPLFACGLTLAVFQLALLLHRRSGWLLLQPVLVAMLLLIGTLELIGLDYADYRHGAEPLTMLLGPATVAFAVPLYQNLARIRELFWPLLLTLSFGAVCGLACTLLFGWLFGLNRTLLMSLAPKSVTMPIAMPLAEQLGGVATLAAVLVMLTGVIGTALAPLLLRLARVEDPAARGITLGMNSHAIGTAYALQEGSECAAFAVLGMILLGVLTAIGLPWLLA